MNEVDTLTCIMENSNLRPTATPSHFHLLISNWKKHQKVECNNCWNFSNPSPIRFKLASFHIKTSQIFFSFSKKKKKNFLPPYLSATPYFVKMTVKSTRIQILHINKNQFNLQRASPPLLSLYKTINLSQIGKSNNRFDIVKIFFIVD